MNLFELITIITLISFVLIFLPDIIPKCGFCGYYKLRPFFKLHKAISLSLGYKGVKSACSKCCKQYNIRSFDDYSKLIHSKKIAKINLLKIFHNW